MSIQLASTDVLQAVLAAAPAMNQLPIHASYVDQGGLGDNLPSVTTGTTPVTFVASPASGVERLVSQISICNDDTAAATVTVNVVRSSAATRLCKITLQPGYALYYDGGWKVLDTNGNFLCNVTSTSGTVTSNQGAAAAITAPWPVELSNGTTAIGTASSPIRIDPTGTTTQPVSVGNFPATQNINITELDGSALAGPTAWGSPPSAGAQVLNVNANIVSGGSGGGNVNVTEWNTVALGSPSSYGTSPGAVAVIGVNAFVTNLPATQPVSGSVSVSNFPATQASNQTQLAGTTLGAPSNYGTSPGLVSVQGVNAFVTNTVVVSGTFWQATQPVSLATLPALTAGSAAIGTVGVTSLPAIPAGSNLIGAVNVTEVAGTTLGVPTSYGTAPTGNVLGVNANVTNTINNSPQGLATGAAVSVLTSTSSMNIGTVSNTYIRALSICNVGAVLAAGSVAVEIYDGGGTLRVYAVVPTAATTALAPYSVCDLQNLAIPLVNGGASPTMKLNIALTQGSIAIGYALF